MVPFVGDGNGSCQVSIFRQGFRTELQVAIYKVGITQTVSERIKRFVTLIQIVAGIPVENTVVRVRTSSVQMIVEQRKLPYRTREGSSQLAARDGFAKQNIGNGIPCLTTSEPYIQNRSETDSPLISAHSPTAATITSARAAVRNASASSC